MIKVTLNEARELYKSNNETLRGLALKAFPEDALKTPNFMNIKTFEDACNALYMNLPLMDRTIREISKTSRAMVAMYKLNIVRKALNLGQGLYLIKGAKDSNVYCPYNPFISKSSTYFESKVKLGTMDVIGKIKNDGIEYIVLNGDPSIGWHSGFAIYDDSICVGHAKTDFGFLGCASAEIAEHFGKYFGMLITEAKYGDVDDFTITEDKYGNA